jgi:hypothetical protein
MPPDGISGKQLQEVRIAVAERLVSDGWISLEQHPLSGATLVLALALGEDFMATFTVAGRVEEDAAGNAALAAVSRLGLDFTPARAITTALVGTARSGGVLSDRQPAEALRGDPESSAAAVAALVRYASRQAPQLARLADVDVLIQMLHDGRATPHTPMGSANHTAKPSTPPAEAGEGTGDLAELVAALLLGAGRYGEARSALLQLAEPASTAAGRRLVRQLLRWSEREGELPLPTTPAQSPADWPRFRRQPNQPPDLTEQMLNARARQEALRAVRRESRGKDRAELRALLSAELSRRSLKLDPVSTEQALNALATAQKPFGKATVALRGAQALRSLLDGGRLVDVLGTTADGAPDPPWMATPERAAYPIHSSSPERVAVELDRGATSWLEEALPAADGKAVDMRRIDVWLVAEKAPPGASRISVHIGSRRIGQLGAEATEQFHAILRAAGERDEAPTAQAHLTRIPGETQYVLDLPSPEG